MINYSQFKKQAILVLFIIFASQLLYAQNGVVSIQSKFSSVDSVLKIVLINKNTEVLNEEFSGIKESINIDNTVYTFTSPIAQLETGFLYEVVSNENQYYRLFFTSLPIVNIDSNKAIVDEPSSAAQFSICTMQGIVVKNLIGIEYRGGWTQTLPKKSYKVEFWQDSLGNKKVDFSLLGMRNDDDWNLQAMYNEPLRIRSKLNYKLWNKIDTLNYIHSEPNAVNGIRQEYVELFVNQEYHGLYALSERIDRKQLKLKKSDDEQIKGELYKGVSWGAPTFTRLPQIDNNSQEWGGFEYVYPNDSINWENLYNLVDFVMNEDSMTFYEDYKEKFHIENLVNYFIFLNLLRATDNEGKNIFVAKYNFEEPYIYVPYDLDGSFGVIWDGTQENISNDLLSNEFYQRLFYDNSENGFTDKLKTKWFALRESIITAQNILSEFEKNYNYLSDNGVYIREKIAWPECQFLDLNNLDFTLIWLEKRLKYLDGIFAKPELLLTNLNSKLDHKNEFKIHPNPTSDYIDLELDSKNNGLRIKILDAMGIKIKSQPLNNNNKTRIDLSNFNNGIYYIILESINKEFHTIHRIIKH